MIPSPLQALAMIALTVLLSGAVMVLVHRHMPLRNKTIADLQDQIYGLEAEQSVHDEHIGRLQRRTGITSDIAISGPVTGKNLNLPADDDAMALWDAIVNDARKHEKDH